MAEKLFPSGALFELGVDGIGAESQFVRVGGIQAVFASRVHALEFGEDDCAFVETCVGTIG